jgi:GNAT superfamily N-acetyltransferase
LAIIYLNLLFCFMNLPALSSFLFQPLQSTQVPALAQYLQGLSVLSRSRFAPHAADEAGIRAFYNGPEPHTGYVAVLPTGELAGYFVVRRSYLPHDAARWYAYGYPLHPVTDFTLAPSVADAWQGKGLAGPLLQWVEARCRQLGARRLLLWGGVQAGNAAAVRFYEKHGFKHAGSFDHHGTNHDMYKDL